MQHRHQIKQRRKDRSVREAFPWLGWSLIVLIGRRNNGFWWYYSTLWMNYKFLRGKDDVKQCRYILKKDLYLKSHCWLRFFIMIVSIILMLAVYSVHQTLQKSRCRTKAKLLCLCFDELIIEFVQNRWTYKITCNSLKILKVFIVRLFGCIENFIKKDQCSIEKDVIT
jgi:hypothetical protein